MIISIVSGKGGTGKTTTTINLGYSLAYTFNEKVLLFDADLGLNNLDLYLNINTEKNIEHFINRTADFQSLIVKAGKIDVISGNSGSLKIANLSILDVKRLVEEIKKISKNYGYVLIDNSPGIHQSVIEFCQISDKIIVIVNPEYPALIDGYQLIKILLTNNIDENKIGLVINKAENEKDSINKYIGINNVIKNYLNKQIKYWGYVEKSKTFDKSLIHQKQVYEMSGSFKKQFDKIIINLLK